MNDLPKCMNKVNENYLIHRPIQLGRYQMTTYYTRQNTSGIKTKISLKMHENRYKQKISTNPECRCFRFAVFTTKI